MASRDTRLRPWALAWLCLGLLLAGGPAMAAPEFDHEHTQWTALLERHLSEGLLDYRALAQDPSQLRAYLDRLERVEAEQYARWNREQRLAFWLNAYNAYTVALVLEHYPVASIKDIGALWRSPFKIDFIPLGELDPEATSLDGIEHRIVRKRFDEARIHFALVCASVGCPPLYPQAFTATRLDQQLEQRTRSFLGDTAYNRWNPETRTLELSELFDWFHEDFERDSDSVEAFVRRHAPPSLTRQLPSGELRIRHLDWDWSLNQR